MSISDRIICMNDGVIQQVDSPMNLYEKPVNKFVAGFLGTPAMNFFEKGDIAEGISKGTSISLKDVDFGIRPERVKLQEELKKSDVEIFSIGVEILSIEALGREVFAVVEHKGLQIKLFIPENNKKNIGEKIQISFLKGTIFTFDKSTGKTLKVV